MKEYTAYFLQVHKILGDAILDISKMFEETNTKEIRLKQPMILDFKPRYAGDKAKRCEIDSVAYNQEMMSLHSGYETYYLYDLADKTDITFVYDMIYEHFYRNDHD
jgi:hypothetical protein